MSIDFKGMASVKGLLWCLVFIVICYLTWTTLLNYPGESYIYLLFSVVSTILLISGFRRNAIFFDAFIGVFFWIGFWLKLSVRVSFAGGLFHDPVGGFGGAGYEFDRALVVTIFGFFGIILASYLRERYIFKYPLVSDDSKHDGVISLYTKFRKYIFIGFVCLILVVAFLNMYLGVYQRGAITRTTLPFGLNGVFKWLLLFGLASFSAVILRLEMSSKRGHPYWATFLSIFESFMSNVSLLSRGMILNLSSLALGVIMEYRAHSRKLSIRFLVICSVIFMLLFASSIYVVNIIRANAHIIGAEPFESVPQMGSLKASLNVGAAKPLFLDRWVGIEGVMAVSSSSKIGWDFWQSAWAERYDENTMGFYDANLITSPYENLNFTKHHYISLPGILAFFFYPGSLIFLFVGMFMLGVFAAMIEIFTFKMSGGNLILCSLIAQVVAYRFASFGYVPIQSYLLVGSIFLNLMVIYFGYRIVRQWGRSEV